MQPTLTFHRQPLRLDLAEGEEPCSPAQVRVNGQPLAQDADGFGQGVLTLDHDITITSNWTFACQSLKQALTVNVHSVNGNPAVDPTFFIAHFYQTTPVQIATVENVADVRYLHLHTTVTESLADSGEEHADVTNGEASEYYDEYPVPVPVLGEGSGGVDEEVAQLKELRRQARELVAMIRDQEDAIMDKLEYNVQEKLAAEPAPTPLGECRDVRCAFKALVYRFRHSHEEVCESGSGWRALFGCAPEEQPWMENDDMYDEEYDAEMDWSPENMEDYDEEMDFVDDMEWLDITNEDWDSEEAFYTNYEEDMLAMYYESVSCSRTPQAILSTNRRPKGSQTHADAGCRNGRHRWRRRLLHHISHPAPHHRPRSLPPPAHLQRASPVPGRTVL